MSLDRCLQVGFTDQGLYTDSLAYSFHFGKIACQSDLGLVLRCGSIFLEPIVWENNHQDTCKPGSISRSQSLDSDAIDLVSPVKSKPLSCFQDLIRCEIDSAILV